MAQPGGSITPSDCGYDAQAGTSYWSYAYFCFRLPFQPRHWQDDIYSNNMRHTVKPSFQHYTAGTGVFRNRWKFRKTAGFSGELGASDTAAGAGWVDRNETQPLPGLCCEAPALPTSSTLPYYTWGFVEFQEPTSGGSTCELLGMYFEHLDTYTYTEPEPTGELSAELTDRATVRLYAADQPASAWHAQWLLCHTLNKLQYEHRQCWSVPA